MKIFRELARLFKAEKKENAIAAHSDESSLKIRDYLKESVLVCKMLAKLAIADGSIDSEELKYIFDEILPKICKDPRYELVRWDFARQFDEAVISDKSFEDYAKEYVEYDSSADFRTVLEMLIELTASDGNISEEELMCLRRFAEICNIDDIDFEKSLDRCRKLRGEGVDMRVVYYARLNCVKDDSFDTVTQNYNVLVKEYRDRLSRYCKPRSLVSDYIIYRKGIIEDAYMRLKAELSP